MKIAGAADIIRDRSGDNLIKIKLDANTDFAAGGIGRNDAHHMAEPTPTWLLVRGDFWRHGKFEFEGRADFKREVRGEKDAALR